ncbi:hypothetical protein HYPDE_25198 [Hyphomicrobium denitrificans 1NES1]|uniref:Uncharacterized protein n=1 Tax=Hyphomicrobium denitrificans 1NES1 TaxID=670307 RepID=N0AZV1_9HYPH|nr:hypothetical protein HYPDE_25198 [Hyphomicrobium denitrificans 1NES1]
MKSECPVASQLKSKPTTTRRGSQVPRPPAAVGLQRRRIQHAEENHNQHAPFLRTHQITPLRRIQIMHPPLTTGRECEATTMMWRLNEM